jgi:hypothetical protein
MGGNFNSYKKIWVGGVREGRREMIKAIRESVWKCDVFEIWENEHD